MAVNGQTNGVMLVSQQAQIDEICARCRREGRFAFDTEFVMEDRFAPEVCLIQIATQGSVFLIDPFLKLDLAPVWQLVCDEKIATIVHAGQEDLSLCFQHTGSVPRNVYDVQIASGLAGYDYPLSLQKLVQLVLHIRLHKTKTLTDWRKRPLSTSQVQYGAEDVAHLLAVHRKLDERLKEWKRRDWAQEEFRYFERPGLYRRASEEKLARVKGAGSLKGRQLAIVRELLAWREERAQQLNRPIRGLLKDHLLVEIAKLELGAFNEIRDLRGLNLGDRDVRALAAVVQLALALPREQWPVSPPREMESPRETALIAFVTALLRSRCLDERIAYGLAASKRSIREIITHGRNAPGESAQIELLTGWRRELLGVQLLEVLNGRAAAFVQADGDEAAIHTAPRDDLKPTPTRAGRD
jgi:ribonuclease D